MKLKKKQLLHNEKLEKYRKQPNQGLVSAFQVILSKILGKARSVSLEYDAGIISDTW